MQTNSGRIAATRSKTYMTGIVDLFQTFRASVKTAAIALSGGKGHIFINLELASKVVIRQFFFLVKSTKSSKSPVAALFKIR